MGGRWLIHGETIKSPDKLEQTQRLLIFFQYYSLNHLTNIGGTVERMDLFSLSILLALAKNPYLPLSSSHCVPLILRAGASSFLSFSSFLIVAPSRAAPYAFHSPCMPGSSVCPWEATEEQHRHANGCQRDPMAYFRSYCSQQGHKGPRGPESLFN